MTEIAQRKGWVYFWELEFQVCRKVAGHEVSDGEWLLIDTGGVVDGIFGWTEFPTSTLHQVLRTLWSTSTVRLYETYHI